LFLQVGTADTAGRSPSIDKQEDGLFFIVLSFRYQLQYKHHHGFGALFFSNSPINSRFSE
ncbi:hypothetical protein L9F63_001760, partial [Diploptera punctata]